jgi:hypothetical protein
MNDTPCHSVPLYAKAREGHALTYKMKDTLTSACDMSTWPCDEAPRVQPAPRGAPGLEPSGPRASRQARHTLHVEAGPASPQTPLCGVEASRPTTESTQVVRQYAPASVDPGCLRRSGGLLTGSRATERERERPGQRPRRERERRTGSRATERERERPGVSRAAGRDAESPGRIAMGKL